MNPTLVFSIFAIVYLSIALSIMAAPLFAGFYAFCFGVSAIKAARANLHTGSLLSA
jgi:hypothetical protein